MGRGLPCGCRRLARPEVSKVRKFRFKTKPRPHQLKEFMEHKDDPNRALLWQMRSGKSKVTIDTMAYQFMKGNITGAIIVAPNEVHFNWLNEEFPRHCPIPYVGHVYRAGKVRTRAHASRMDKIGKGRAKGHIGVLCINTESIRTPNAKKTIESFISVHKGKVFLVVDEVHDFRTPGSKRTRRIMGIRKHCPYKRILTGTAVKNNALAAYSQFEILAPSALGYRNFGEFKQAYAVYVDARTRGGRTFPQLQRYQNLDDLQERISKWSSVVLKKDCGIAESEPVVRTYEMLPAQRKLYDKLVEEYTLEEAAYDGGARTGKLQQIARGWYYDEFGEAVDIIPPSQNPAYQILEREIDTQDTKTIVWCQYKHEIKTVVELLRAKDYMVVEYHGGVKAEERAAAIKAFMNHEGPAIFVGQPQAGGTGINLSAADVVIWFSIPQQNLILYEQASERATEVNAEAVEKIHIVAKDSVDEIQHEGLKNKQTISDMLAETGLKDLLKMQELI